MTLDDLRHLALPGGIVSYDSKVIDRAALQVVMHEADGPIALWAPTALAGLSGSLEIHRFLDSCKPNQFN